MSKSRTWSVFGDDSYSEKQAANDNDDYDDFMFEKEDKRKSRDDNVIRQKKATGKQKEDDDGTQMIEETIIWNDIKEKKDQKRKWDGLFERGDKKKETIDIVDEEDDVFDYNTLQYKDKKPKLSSQTKAKDYDDFEFAPPNKVRKLNHDSNASKVDSKPKDDPPVTNTKASFKQNNPKKREWRKEFMTAWLKKFQ